jgi:hypothetical protein
MQISNQSAMLKRHLFTRIGVFRAYFARKINRLGMFFTLLFNLLELQQLLIKY